MVDAILEFIEDLTQRCPLLKILTLQSLPKDYYSTRDLKIVSASLLKLEITGGTYPTLRDILNCDCPQLIALNLRESNIDNFNLDAILRNCPRLHSLDITECKQLTASRKLGSLRQLRVLKAHKTNLELGCVLDVLKRCGRLQTVEYSRCHNVVPVSREEAELKKIEEDIKEEVRTATAEPYIYPFLTRVLCVCVCACVRVACRATRRRLRCSIRVCEGW